MDHVDDLKTPWYKCGKCEQQTSRPLTGAVLAPEPIEPVSPEVDAAVESDAEGLAKPVTLDEIRDILESTIRHDERNKLITFLSMLLTYTEEDQINVSFTAESSTGKSYIPLELAWYFPKEDIIEYSYVSPTAFFHEYGAFVPDPTDKRELEDEKQRRKIIVIDLHQKILVFIDQPHDMLLQRLRPLLSHDRKQLIAKITDRREKAGLRTKTVLINGYPTVLFCTAKFSMEDQERTRLLLLSPETSQEKIRDAILLKIEKDSDRQAFQKYMDSDPRRLWLRRRVDAVATSGVRYIVIPEELRVKISSEFLKMHTSSLVPRHQRDITRLLALVKAHALLNLWGRQHVDDAIIVNEEDVLEGFRLYNEISTANELGLPPEVYSVFLEIKERIPGAGATKKELQALYYQTFHRTIGTKRLDEVLGLLESVGLFAKDVDPTDKRRMLFSPTCAGVFNSEHGEEGAANEPKLNTLEGVGNTESQSQLELNTPEGVSGTGSQAQLTFGRQVEGSVVLAYQTLRSQLQSPFTQKDAIDLIGKARTCDESEAEHIFRALLDEGKVAMTPEGLWWFL